MDTAFEERRPFLGQVVDSGAGMIVEVVSEIGGLLVKPALRNESHRFQVYAVLVIDSHNAQALPLIQHDTGTDVLADRRHQGIERALSAIAGQARQGQRAARLLAERRVVQPDADQVRPKRDELGQSDFYPGRLGPQASHILAMHPRQQADPAVGRRLAVEAKLALGDINEYLLEQIGKAGVSDPFFEHQPH
ncbi:hypothetical protein D9M71_379290 [compost metagenome]